MRWTPSSSERAGWAYVILSLLLVVLAIATFQILYPRVTSGMNRAVGLLVRPSPVATPVVLEPPTPEPPTPTPTPLPPTPTPYALSVSPTPLPTPTPQGMKYPAPVLISPPDGAVIQGAGQVFFLEWSFPQPLAPGEAFDVRVWKAGAPNWGVAHTRETRWQVSPNFLGGTWFWAIAVVTDDERAVPLSPQSEVRTFSWQP